MSTSTLGRFVTAGMCGVIALVAAPAHARQGSQSAMQSSFGFYWAVTGPREPEIDLSSTPMKRSDYVMLYEHDFGLFPRVYNDRYENGSIPQRVNMPAHLAKVRQDIARKIPDPNFSGFVSIDCEYGGGWPWWEKMQWNTGLVAECIRYTKERHPSLSGAALQAKAAEEYEEGLRQLLVATINACKAERPKAKWGYNGTTHHDQRVVREKFQPIYDAVTAFFPVIYANAYSVADDKSPGKDQAQINKYKYRIGLHMAYAREIAGNRPVIGLIWIRYHNVNPTYGFQPVNNLDLDAMLIDPAILGANGVVFWDYVGDTQTYNVYRNYVATKVAPRIQAVLAMFEPQRATTSNNSSSSGQQSTGQSSSNSSNPPSSSSEPPPSESAPANVYGQAHVDAINAAMGSRKGRPKFDPMADVDLNNKVQRRDRDLVLANWGEPVVPPGTKLEFPKKGKSGKKK